MNNDTFFQLLVDYETNHNLFYVDQNKTYADLIRESKQIATAIEKNYFVNKKFGLAIKDPYLAFCAQLALFLLNKEFTLLSYLEPLHRKNQMQKDYGLSLIFTDEDIREFLNFNDAHLKKLAKIQIKETGLNVLSSGSSSLSKEIFHPILNLYLSANNFIQYFHSNNQERFVLNLPHHHVGGLLVLWRAFFSGASFQTETTHSFDYISLVPLQLKRLLEEEAKVKAFQKVKAILIGGALLDEVTKSQALNVALNIYETYAMSETATFVMLNGETLGQNEVKLDKENYILIKSPHLSPSVKVDKEGFYHTKDQGELEDNKIHFVARRDLMFKSAGELLDPVEIENQIKHLPYIKNCLCTETNDYIFQKALVCFYELNKEHNQINEEQIKKDLKEKLHPYQIPRSFFRVNEKMSFTEGLKPKRYLFKEEANLFKLKEKFHFEFIDRQESKTLVALHGFMEDLTDFYFLKELKNYNLLLIDLPGHGQSPIDHFKEADEVYFYLNELIHFFSKSTQIHLYGYSMGGRIALELLKRGLSVDELILESSSLGFFEGKERADRLKKDQSLFNEITSDQLITFFNQWYANPIFTGYKETVGYQTSIEKKSQHNPKLWQKALNFFSPGNSLFLYDDYIKVLENIPRIKAISGSLDQKYDELYKGVVLDHWQHYSLLDVGHNPHKMIPEKIREIILI